MYHLRRFVRRVIHKDHPVIQVRKVLAQLAHELRDVLGLVPCRYDQGKEYLLLAPPALRPAGNRLLVCFHGRSRLAYRVNLPKIGDKLTVKTPNGGTQSAKQRSTARARQGLRPGAGGLLQGLDQAEGRRTWPGGMGEECA